MDTHALIDELTKMGISILLGGLLGLEREYQNKPAGFRTLALICIGATAFTILSIRLSGDGIAHDRIAANIITGIGFIGAGVIFKSGVNVYGLTTAATIWVTAGIGMAVGAGDYLLACVITGVTLLILSLFEYLQNKVDILHKRRLYFISFDGHVLDTHIENEMRKAKLKYKKLKEKRSQNETTCSYEVFGRESHLDIFNEFLLETPEVKQFEY
jgi:putative Mg2+ transporter-C (MgtC) family protein